MIKTDEFGKPIIKTATEANALFQDTQRAGALPNLGVSPVLPVTTSPFAPTPVPAPTNRAAELKANAAARGLARQQAQPIDIAGIDAKYKQITDQGGTIDPAAVLKEKTAAIEYNNALASASEQKQPKKTKDGQQESPQFDTTSNLAGIMENVKGLDPDVAAAVLPSITSRLDASSEVSKTSKDIQDTFQTDKEIKGAYAGQEARALSNEQKYLDKVQKDEAIALEAENINKQQMELGKQMMLHKQSESEQEQIKRNIQNEKKMRRQLNALGLETDIKGLEYLENSIDEGQKMLQNIRESTSLMTRKYDLEIGQRYANNVKAILADGEEKYLQVQNATDEKLDAIKNAVSMSKSERDKEIRATLKWESEQKTKYDIEIADQISQAKVKTLELKATKDKTSKDAMMTAKDKLGFVGTLRSSINSNKTITQANDADGFYGALTAAYEYYKYQLTDANATNDSRNAAQTAVIGSFARILDPNSVVRNEEYERQVYGQSFLNTARGFWEKASKGGSGMTEADITAMKNVAEKIHSSWEDRLQQSMQQYIIDINDWNTNYPEAKIDYAQVIPVNRIHLPESTTSTWESSYTIGSTPPSFTPESTDARTDRHNNPTAFTVNTARQAGLEEGVDYVVGDPFPNNPNLFTARLLGDPINTTIRVIDQIGFYTKNGNQRWTHTAMKKDAWDSLTYNQKMDTIIKMYANEGGSGVLATENRNQLAFTPANNARL
ncbi:MAG: hypothetical protein H7831_08450 [Magnetococcus sp. WYHC-3]